MAGTFKKGKSKKRIATDILERIVHQDPNGIHRAWLAQIARAQTGDTTAMSLIVAYLDGKPHQSVDMDVEINNNVETSSADENLKALRDRMAGILPKRTLSSVEGGGGEGSGGDQKPH